MSNAGTCWFCEKEPAADEAVCNIRLKRKGSLRTISVPRCGMCRDADLAMDRVVYLPTVVSYLALWGGLILFTACGLHRTPTLVLEALGALPGGFLVWEILQGTARRIQQGRRASDEARQWPEVAALMAHGWRLTTPPPPPRDGRD